MTEICTSNCGDICSLYSLNPLSSSHLHFRFLNEAWTGQNDVFDISEYNYRYVELEMTLQIFKHKMAVQSSDQDYHSLELDM